MKASSRQRSRQATLVFDALSDHVDRCAYCDARLESVEIPEADDGEAWDWLAGMHQPWCEWVRTRARQEPRRGEVHAVHAP